MKIMAESRVNRPIKLIYRKEMAKSIYFINFEAPRYLRPVVDGDASFSL